MTMSCSSEVRLALWFGVGAVFFLSAGCTHPNVKTLEAYRSAKKSGDYATAATYLSDDARIWFGKKEGDGQPLIVKGGTYQEWDKEFRSTSRKEDVLVTDHQVSYTIYESNDFYRLIDGEMGPARLTYYFDESGRIKGKFYRAVTPKVKRAPNKLDEFKRWAAQNYPGLLDSADMNIPNQPQRWRELLTEWRADVGLAAIE